MDERHHACFCPKRHELAEWRESNLTTDVTIRRATKPDAIARAELILGILERFNYPSLTALYAEDGELFALLDAESFGDRGIEIEKAEQMQAEMSEVSEMENRHG